MAPNRRPKSGRTSSDASSRPPTPAPSESASKEKASPNSASEQGGWAPVSSSESIRPAMTATLMTFGLFMSVYIITKSNLPNIKTYQPSADMPFDWVNAKKHIIRMGKRYRFVGSAGLDDALAYIQSEMAALSEQAKRNDLDLQLDWFQSAPSSFLTSVGPINIRNSYDNLSSIVVRVTPHDVDIDSRPPLLLNAHVDSAIGAPGVNDELSGVGVLMDIVRAVVSVPNDNDPQHQKHRLNRPVIFLFNGAEEVVLQGAHSFITQHPWGRKVAAHINLESLGSGSEYLVFRLGPKHPWLAHAYARSVSYPVASVTATDVYNTKLIPGETDFRIFDEFAGIPGFDFVYTDNGYIYHTQYDDAKRLDNQGLLHAGVTVYELMMELAGKNDAIGAYLEGEDEAEPETSPVIHIVRQSAHYVSSIFNSNHHAKPLNERQMVFFDVLHHYTVVYDEELAFFLHGSILVFAVLVWTIKIGSMPVTEWVSFFRMVYVFIVAMFCALLSSTYASIVYARALITPLIWYGSMTRAILVFGLPALSGLLTGLLNTLPRRLSRQHFEHALFGHSFFLMVLCFFLLRANVMSAYVPALCLFVSTLVAMESPAVSPLNRHMQISVIHAVMTCRLFTTILSTILPIFGRVSIGSTEPMVGDIQVALSDIVVSIFVTVTLLVHIGLPLLPILAYFAPAIRRLRSVFLAASLWTAFIFLIVLPKLNGHRERGIITPYSEDAPKRLSFIHFHAPQMYNTTDASPFSVLQVASMDAVDVNLERLCANLATTSDADEGISSLPASPTFGSLNVSLMESIRPFHVMVHHKHWLRSGNIPLLEVPTIDVEHESIIEGTMEGTDGQMERNGASKAWNISVAIHAPDSHQVTIRMKSKDNGGPVSQWSFNSPLEDSSGFVWVKHTGSEKMRFWLIIPTTGSGDNTDQRPKVTIALSNMRLGKSRSPGDFIIIDKNVKPWESPFYLVSTAVEVEV